MGLLKKLFSIPAKFARVFSFYNKNGLVTRIFTLLGAIIFTLATIFLEKWAFGLFADNYFWGLLALIFSFSIGLGCAEFLIMCCITAVLSTLKSSVVDTAKFISKKSKEKKEKNGENKDSGSESELNSEGLSELRAAEQNLKKSSKDTGFGFKDAVNPEEWENITKTLQQAGETSNLENISLVQTVLDSRQENENNLQVSNNAEDIYATTQNLTDNNSETTISDNNEQVVKLGQSDEITPQIQPESVGLNEQSNNEVVVNLEQNVEVQPQTCQPGNTQTTVQVEPVTIQAIVQPEVGEVSNEQIIQHEPIENVQNTQTENIETTSQVENTTEVLQTDEITTEGQVVQTLKTQETPAEEQITVTENGEEETKTNLESESQKLENILENEKKEIEELENKKKKSHKIFDIFCALIFAFLGFVVVTQYIAIFKENADALKFWEKIDFSKIWEWIKFWD